MSYHTAAKPSSGGHLPHDIRGLILALGKVRSANLVDRKATSIIIVIATLDQLAVVGVGSIWLSKWK
jgi:hypothetical protein